MKAHKRMKQKTMSETPDEIVIRNRSTINGDAWETNSKSSSCCNSRTDRRRRSGGGVPQRRLGLVKSFSSLRFLPLENDGEDDKVLPLPTLLLDESINSSLTSSTIETPSSGTASYLSCSSSKASKEGASPQKAFPPIDSNTAEAACLSQCLPPLPPRRARSGSISTGRRRSMSMTKRSLPRSTASPSLKLEALEDELDSLNRELTEVEVAQEAMQQQKLRAEKVQLQLQQEYEVLQADLKLKLMQIETFESENDRLQEECLHYETQVFAMTKSLEACITERDTKKEEFKVIHDEWMQIQERGSDLVQALHEHHTTVSSPDHIDLELQLCRQKEVLEELQEEVRQVREEVRPYQYESHPPVTTTPISARTISDPQPHMMRSLSISPKRNLSMLSSYTASSPGSRSSGSSRSHGGGGDTDYHSCDETNKNSDGTSKDRRKAAAKELRNDLQQRRHRRSSISTNDSR